MRQVYGAYDRDPRRRRIWGDNAASRHEKDRKWAKIDRVLGCLAPAPPGAWAVDLGAEGGGDSARLKGAAPGLRGIIALDLRREPLAGARGVGPLLHPLAADGARVPLKTASVGLVYQSVMLSSTLDPIFRAAIFAEIRRVLAPGGVFLSYDTRYPNPWNADTRPVGLAELRAAFASWPQTGRSVTGIPQILRLLAPWSLLLCRMVEALPPLRSHRLFAAAKPGGERGAPTARASAAARGSSAPSA